MVGTTRRRRNPAHSVLMVAAVLLGIAVTLNPAEGAYPGFNGRIVFEDGVPRRIFVIDADGTNRTDLGAGSNPTWSPDGTKIAFALNPDIWVMNADGSGRRRVSNDPGGTHRVSSPTWSPDGTMIAFNVDGTTIWVVNVDGTGQRLLVDPPPVAVGALAWSPLGDKIAFGTDDIWVVNADGTSPVNITQTQDKYERDPDWKPDGTRIVFERGQPEEIWTMNSDGTGQTNITPAGASSQAADPAWSPDGTKIVFVWGGIRIMNADGTGVSAPLTGGLLPDWQPTSAPVTSSTSATSSSTSTTTASTTTTLPPTTSTTTGGSTSSTTTSTSTTSTSSSTTVANTTTTSTSTTIAPTTTTTSSTVLPSTSTSIPPTTTTTGPIAGTTTSTVVSSTTTSSSILSTSTSTTSSVPSTSTTTSSTPTTIPPVVTPATTTPPSDTDTTTAGVTVPPMTTGTTSTTVPSTTTTSAPADSTPSAGPAPAPAAPSAETVPSAPASVAAAPTETTPPPDVSPQQSAGSTAADLPAASTGAFASQSAVSSAGPLDAPASDTAPEPDRQVALPAPPVQPAPRAQAPPPSGATTQASPVLAVTTAAGAASGPPGSGLQIAGTDYPPECDRVYVFFDGDRIGTARPEGGRVAKTGLSVPGDARTGPHSVTSSCRASGTPVLSAAEFVVTEEPLHRTAFTTSMPKPEHVEFGLAAVLLSVLGVLGLLMLIAFPAELFNTTLEEHYDEVRGWFRLPPRDLSAGTGLPHLGLFVAFLALSGPLWFVMQDSAALDLATGVAALGLSLATAVVVLLGDLPTFAHLRRHYGERARVVALPGSLVVALVCILLSRAVNFQPGYFYGLVGGLAFGRQLRRDTSGRLAASSAAILLLLSVVSWVGLGPVSEAAADPGAGLGLILAENFLGGIFWVALDSLIIALIPLRLLAGSKIVGWNRKVWFVIYGMALFAFVHILLRPGTGYVADTTRSPAVVVVGLFVIFALLSLSFWAYFRFRAPRAPTEREMAGVRG